MITGTELIVVIALAVVAIVLVLRDARGRERNQELNRRVFGTVGDPRVERMVERQKAYGRRLRREGRSLLSGKKIDMHDTVAFKNIEEAQPAPRIYAVKK